MFNAFFRATTAQFVAKKISFHSKEKHWLECLSQVCLGNTIALISLMLQAGSRCFQELSASQTP